MSEELNRLTINADGVVQAEPGALKRLATTPGHFRVLPTVGDLIILQRMSHDPPADEARSTPGRVVLSGEIDLLGGLVDVINFIHGNAWSGQLAIVDGPTRKTIYFRRGDIRTAASNVPEDRLGAILYRYGVISDDVLNEALRLASGSSRLGQALVERGALTPHDLYTYVRKQVEEIFFSALVLRQGSFYFYRTGDDEGPASQLQLSTKTLLFDGVRRIDELAYFREKVPSASMIPVRRKPSADGQLLPQEERVLELVDGRRTLGAIARSSHLGEFETTKIIYQLLQSGYVQAAPTQFEGGPLLNNTPNSTPNGTHQTSSYGRIIDTFNVVYGSIYATVSGKGKLDGLKKGLESFFGSVSEFAPLFVGVTLTSDGILPRDPVLANLEIAPVDNKFDYLHRALNELLFFELFTAGEAVDRREEIELHQRLNQIMRELNGEAAAPRAADGAAETSDEGAT